MQPFQSSYENTKDGLKDIHLIIVHSFKKKTYQSIHIVTLLKATPKSTPPPLLKYAQISAPFPTQAIIIECNIKLGNLGRQHLIFNYNSQLIYKKNQGKGKQLWKKSSMFFYFSCYILYNKFDFWFYLHNC